MPKRTTTAEQKEQAAALEARAEAQAEKERIAEEKKAAKKAAKKELKKHVEEALAKVGNRSLKLFTPPRVNYVTVTVCRT